jgi:hypothetical protein
MSQAGGSDMETLPARLQCRVVVDPTQQETEFLAGQFTVHGGRKMFGLVIHV